MRRSEIKFTGPIISLICSENTSMRACEQFTTAVMLTNRRRRCKMKGLLIFPPQWYPGNPYTALPLLQGRLREAGFDVSVSDLNIRFYNDILTYENVLSSFKRAREETENEQSDSPDSLHIDALNKFLSSHSESEISAVAAEIGHAITVHKTTELFYDANKLFKARRTLFSALDIVSLPYAPHGVSFFNCGDSRWAQGFEKIDSVCSGREKNLFFDYYTSHFDSVITGDADYFIITVADMTQLIASFTLARLIKKRLGRPVCIGGNIITKLYRDLARMPGLFGEYCDYICCGTAETNLVDFAAFAEGKIRVQDVHGIMYLKDGSLTVNPPAASGRTVSLCLPDFTGIDFGSYFSPERVWPIQFSHGCYWGKCAFCDVSFDRSHFSLKKPETAFAELKELNERHGIRHFFITDDSISPTYFEKLSSLIISDKLDVRLFSMARLESKFTDELFELMYKAGFRIIFWGYESASPRVLGLINKGIDADGRLPVLQRSHNAGIWNHVALLIGFPTETRQEADETETFIEENAGVIDSGYISRFSFKKNAVIAGNPADYGVRNVRQNAPVSLDCEYDSVSGMDEPQKRKFVREIRERYLGTRKRCLWPYLCSDFDYLLLYISFFGRDKVRRFRLEDDYDEFAFML